VVNKIGVCFTLTVLLLVGTLLTGCTTSSRSTPIILPSEASEEELTEWDLVLFSDSSGWGVADRYAAYIEEDLDVTVQVHDLAASGLSAGSVLAALRGERSPYPSSVDVAGLVREAEVVVVYGNPLESNSEAHRGDWNCVSRTAPYARDCAAKTFDAYRADLGAIYEEILNLRGDQPVLIRAFDAYNPLYSVYRQQGVYDECLGCWENYSQAIHQAAIAHNVPVARVFDAFNGPDHDEDPRDKGYIRDDGIRTTAAGRRVIADLLREAGYEPTLPVSATPEPTAAAESGGATWSLVVLGDSLAAEDHSVSPEAYAAHLKEDLGVEVEIQNLAVCGETTRSLLADVQKYPWYRQPIQEVEVILISVGGGDLPGRVDRFFRGECGSADNQDCLCQQLAESQANWDALLDEIVSLADPRETLIRPIIPRVLEYPARVYKDRPEDVEVCNSYVVTLYEHMARSCAERGIPVLDLYALYDGPNADPNLPDIAGTGDGVHVSDEGDVVIAGLLRELGYDPAEP
jgi:lysophospholipase L1-like esterase